MEREVVQSGINQSGESGMIGISERFAVINKLITRDVNKNIHSPKFYKYTKDDISDYLADPYRYEDELRRAVVYIYGASSHFRRMIQYFVSLSDLAYVVSPYKIDPERANKKTVNTNYRKVLNLLSSMNIRTQFPQILTVCLREDTFYGTMHVNGDAVTIQQLPSEYCTITSIEDNVPNVTFNFSYFDTRQDMLDFYPEEFRIKYTELYLKDRIGSRWIELDAPTSFAIKCNNDILDYAIPPFVGILRDLFDLEDYRQLKLSKTALENYAMIVMTLGVNDQGEWTFDYKKAVQFWQNLDAVLPEEIGSILTPMPVEKISFEKSNIGDTDTITEAEQNLFTAAGVPSQIFNNPKASAGALLLSIKADQAITYGIVKSIEDMLNRYLHYQKYGKNFKVTFLDVSPFNRKEMGDQYLKACQYGVPMISYYCASQGLGQAEIDCMNFLEDDVLGLAEKFSPLRSSATLSSSDTSSNEKAVAGNDNGAGAPQKDDGDLTDSGEQSREDSDDWD